ncbi:phage tail tape measure protein [Rhizobium sp. YIM 134829]|uniref:phage tail tape measure protein n=1 Tax=Rhizobium sp. YIM 134829 TaxID=3390453 RepID=UPI00397C57C7
MASAVIGALRVNLGIDSAEFQDGLKKVQSSLAGVGKSMQSAGKSMAAFVTAPLAGAGIAILKTAGDFEASMNRVQAATNASSSEFTALSDLALQLGANTSKSASESADMMEMLAKNGLTATQILDGAATASIKLSEATGGDLATSADVATNVMAQFKIEAKDLGQVVDGITNVTLASQFGFNDYKDAIAQAGGVAGALGVSFEDFNAAIAGTSSVFNSGADAGTSFKTFLTTLVPKSDAAAAEMERLGLEFFNANGSMKSMAEIAEELKTSLSGLSDEAKTNAVSEIFGQDAMRTALALADQGAAGIDKLAVSIQRKGSADEQAAARMKGFNGELEKLGGALETLANKIASGGLLQFATSLISKMSQLVDSLSKTSPQLLNWGVVVAGVAAALGPVLITLGLVATGIAAIGAPVAAAVAAFAALSAAGVALYQNWDVLKEKFPTVTGIFETLGSVMATTASGLATQTALISQYLMQMLSGDLQGAGQTVREIFVNIGNTFTELANTVIPGAGDMIKTKVSEIAAYIVDVFKALPGQMLQIGTDIIAGLWNGISAKWEEVKGGVRSIMSYIPGVAREETDTHSPSRVMHEIGQDIMQGLANGITQGSTGSTAAARTAAQQVSSELSNVTADTGGDPWAGLREATDGAKEGMAGLGDAGQSVADKIAGAFGSIIDGSKKLKDVIRDTFADIGSSLMKSGLQSIFGGLFGGGGGFQANTTLGAILGAVPGFANGGSFQVGGAGGIDSQLVAFKASPNERVSITKPGQGRSRGNTFVTNLDMRGSNWTEAQINAKLDQRDRRIMEQVRGNVTGWVGEDHERFD